MTDSGNRLSIGEQLEIFSGAASSAVAHVYVEYPAAPGGGNYRLSGTVAGPYCRYSSTLPARLPLVDQGAGPTVLARAVVPDPCLWAPDLPALYVVDAVLTRSDQPIATVTQRIGIRGLGVEGRHLFCENRRTVLRGWSTIDEPSSDRPEWRDLMMSASVMEPSDMVCEQASDAGVLLIAHVPSQCDPRDAWTRLARWPAVGLVTLDGQQCARLPALRRFGRPLVAQRVSAETTQLATAAELAWLEVTDRGPAIAFVRRVALPVIAFQRGAMSDLATARRASERLQAHLAPDVDLAGYFVGELPPLA